MTPDAKEYSLLQSDDDTGSTSNGDDILNHCTLSRSKPPAVNWPMFCLTGLLAVSIATNIILALNAGSSRSKSQVNASSRSPYAGLESNLDNALIWNTRYSGTNATEVNLLWNEEIPWESGIIALSNSEAMKMGLPASQPFPWDGEQKSIYIVNGHHILHCVRNIYISVHEYRTNRPQSVEYPHILHCLDTIRLETLCAADDTPRYVPLNGQQPLKPGDGQLRKCRDWSKLEEWVQNHDACYKYIQPGNKEISNLERFKYCANDSVYLPLIREFFGYKDDWFPWPYVEQASWKHG